MADYGTIYLTVRVDVETEDGFDPAYVLENLIYDFSAPPKSGVKVLDADICDINDEE